MKSGNYSHKQLVLYALNPDALTKEKVEEMNQAIDADEDLLMEVEGIRMFSLEWDAYTPEAFHQQMAQHKAQMVADIEAFNEVSGSQSSREPVRLFSQLPPIALYTGIAAVIILLIVIFLPNLSNTTLTQGQLLAELEQNLVQSSQPRVLKSDSPPALASREDSLVFEAMQAYQADGHADALKQFDSITPSAQKQSDLLMWKILCLIRLQDSSQADEERLRILLSEVIDEAAFHGKKREEFARSVLEDL